MVENNLDTNSSLSFWDIIFIVGVIFAPFTALRVFKFGPGEILLIIWMLVVLYSLNFKIFLIDLNRYQLFNLCMMAIGGFVSLLLYHETLSLVEYITHVFMLVFTITLANFYQQIPLSKIEFMLSKICKWGTIVYLFLWIWGTFVSGHLLGVNLWLGGKGVRFRALALNPHQVCMITGTMVFFSTYLFSHSKRLREKAVYLACSAAWFWLSLATKSDTILLAFLICGFAAICLIVIKTGADHSQRVSLLIGLITIGILVSALVLPLLYSSLLNYIHNAGNGDGRLELVYQAKEMLDEKYIGWFIGLGPGSHTGNILASGNEQEFHNTYVQQIVNGGIFVCICYLIVVIRIMFPITEKRTSLVLVVLFFILYGFGGNMNRRVIMWFAYTTVIYLEQKRSDEMQEEEQYQ